jgi:HK97 family phage portal protein
MEKSSIRIPNVFKVIGQAFSKKQSATYRAILMLFGNNPAWTKKDFAKLTEAGFMNCITVYACVSLIARLVARLPWVLNKKPMSSSGPKAKIERIEEHDLLNLVKKPNPREGQAAFIENVMSYYLISGNSYIERVGPKVGPPKELYCLRPDRMKVIPGSQANLVAGYKYEVGGQKVLFNDQQILHMKTFHPLDDWYGLSPLEVAAKAIDISNMALTWNAKLLENDMRPPGAMSTEQALEDEQYERLKKEIKEKLQGYQNAGEPLLLEAGLKWENFAITPKDADWLNSDRMNDRRICRVYNISPELVGDAENKTYSNYQEARKALYLETILVHGGYLRDELNNWLTPAWETERLYLDIDRDQIEEIREEMAKIYDWMERAWWLSINERRVACGKDEIGPEGNVIMVPAKFIPLSDISGNIEEE